MSEELNFVPLQEVKAAQYNDWVRAHPPHTNFSWGALQFFWPDARVARYGNGVALLIRTSITSGPFITVLASDATPSESEKLWAFAHQREIRLSRVPSYSLGTLGEESYAVENRDYFEYIISVKRILHPTIESVRLNHEAAANFQRVCEGLKVVQVLLSSAAVLRDIKAISSAWLANRKAKTTLHVWEHESIQRCLARFADHNLIVLAAYSGRGEMLGFTINEPVHGEQYMAHFGKVLENCGGLTEHLEIETAKTMQSLGCSEMNLQDDLGVHGLRRMKMSWAPVRFLEASDARRGH